MRIACSFLFMLLFAANVPAQSGLTIDKVNRGEIKAAVQEVAFSSVLEGTVDDPNLAVYVMVQDPAAKSWRSHRATVAVQNPDAAGRYKWYAICHFGKLDGQGVGSSYQVRAIAVDSKKAAQVQSSGSPAAGTLQSQTLTFKRVKK